MKKILFAIIAFSLFACILSAEDTGTYKIQDYRVKLTPHSDGAVEIEYYQKWIVTGGHIPWITVGMPNSDFGITGNGAAVKQIGPANENGWSGVRIDLDRDYQPGESFEVNFSVTEHKLFSADNVNYVLKFTPGWYDRAVTDHLTIEMVCFAKMEQISASPEPTSKTGNSLIWEKENLGEGKQFEISVSFPKNFASIAANEIKPENSSSETRIDPFMIFFLVIFIIIVIVRIFSKFGGGFWGYSGGTYFGSGGFSAGGNKDSSGGGGFGGRSFSCACACVSCACACACAGGGGAGCSQKFQKFSSFQRRVKC